MTMYMAHFFGSHFDMAMKAPAKGIIGAILFSRSSFSSPRTRKLVYLCTILWTLWGILTLFTT